MAPQVAAKTNIKQIITIAVFSFLIPLTVNAMEAKLTRFTLPNGLKVFVKEDHAVKVATIQLWVMVGSSDEVGSEKGISHLIEHMAFKGTERRGVGEIAREVEALGGATNAYTSLDETVFHVTVPSRATLKGLDIILDAVLNPIVDPKELEKEKQVVVEEILDGLERPVRKSTKQLFKTAYVKSPYHYPVIGFKKNVEAFTREDIISFRKKWYVPENMFLVIVGDVDPDKLKPEIERLTGKLKANGFFRPPKPVEPVQEKIRTALVRDNNSRETRYHIAFHIPSMKGADVNSLDVAASILGGRDSSRLTRLLKKEKGLVNSISTYALTLKDSGLFLISATLDAKNLEVVTKTVFEEIQRLGKEIPSSEEVDRAKTDIESNLLYANETVDGIGQLMGSFEAQVGDITYEKKYLSLNRAVTAQEASKVVTKYLAPPNVTLSALVPEGEVPDFKMEKLEQIVDASSKPPRPTRRLRIR
ncbi:M16 family metallopeptidase [Thermodesulfobacteriota bacterium]